MPEPETPNPKPVDATPTPEPVTTPEPEPADDETLGEAGKKALAAERKRADEAEKLAKKLQADADKAAADKATADAADAEQKGEWERLAKERETALKTKSDDFKNLTTERDDLLAKVAAYEDRDRKTIDDGVKDLPDDLKDFDPGADVPLDTRMTWFTKARKHANERTANGTKFPRTPNPNGNIDQKQDEAARLAASQAARRKF